MLKYYRNQRGQTRFIIVINYFIPDFFQAYTLMARLPRFVLAGNPQHMTITTSQFFMRMKAVRF